MTIQKFNSAPKTNLFYVVTKEKDSDSQKFTLCQWNKNNWHVLVNKDRFDLMIFNITTQDIIGWVDKKPQAEQEKPEVSEIPKKTIPKLLDLVL